AIYSSVDEELTYQWDDETWKKTSGECSASYAPGDAAPMADPVPTLDDDDEIAFMASDAGLRAPAGVVGPRGTGSSRQEVWLPTVGYVYLFLSPSGSSFNATN